MSISTLSKNVYKTWADLRVQDMTVYGNLSSGGGGTGPYFIAETITLGVTGFNNALGVTTTATVFKYNDIVKFYFNEDVIITPGNQVNNVPLILTGIPTVLRPITTIVFPINISTGIVDENTVSPFGIAEFEPSGTINIYTNLNRDGFALATNDGGMRASFVGIYTIAASKQVPNFMKRNELLALQPRNPTIGK